MDIIGYSLAGEETVVAMPQLDVCFDIGKAPEQVIHINHLLLTHGHIDHASGIAYYLSHRQFSGQKPGTVLLPAVCLEPVQDLLAVWGRLDGSNIPAKLVPMRAGDEYQIKPNHFVHSFATRHCYGSLGFVVYEQRKKLRPELIGKSGVEIANLKKQGVDVDYTLNIPLVAYPGDTKYIDFTKNELVANSKILIAECTFVEDEHTGRAEAGRHMYVDELVKMLCELNNEHIILTHLSQRTGIGLAKKILREKLPRDVYEKVIILMALKKI